MISCEFGEIFKNTYFGEHLRTAASESMQTDVREMKARLLFLRSNSIIKKTLAEKKVKMSRQSRVTITIKKDQAS